MPPTIRHPIPIPLPNRIKTTALNEALSNLHPRNTSELIVGLREHLAALDEHAQQLLDTALEAQQGEVIQLDMPPFSVPPGAAQCSHSEYQRYSKIDSLSAGSVFTTSVSHWGIVAGKYMYEVMLMTGGSMQIGFCGPMNMFLWDHKSGVGNFPFTVGYDGSTCQLLNVDAKPAGWKWSAGDIIGVAFDLDIGEVSYFQNGKFVVSCAMPTVRSLMAAGVPHSDRDIELCYFPAVSLGPWQQCHINQGGFPFMFPIEGFGPIDASCEYLYTTWVPRMGTMDIIPPHLAKYESVIISVLLEKMCEDPEGIYMDFGSIAYEYLWTLQYVAPERGVRMLHKLRAAMGDDMFLDMSAGMISCCCVFANLVSFNDEYILNGSFFIIVENADLSRVPKGRPNPCLFLFSWILEHVPDAIHRWARLYSVGVDLMLLADLKMPNEKDLEDLFPEIEEEDVLMKVRSEKLYAAQELVASKKLKPDEVVRHHIFCKLVADKAFKGNLAVILNELVSEIKEVAKDPSKRHTHRTYSERMVSRFFFHVAFAVAELNAKATEKQVAEVACPPCVLKMPIDYPNFSGIPHSQLLRQSGSPDFSNVPTVTPSNPECLMFSVFELYMLVVKGWMVGSFNEIVSNQIARQQYEAARAEGSRSEIELDAMRQTLIRTTREMSWTMSSLFLAGFHRFLASVASMVFKMVNYYSETSYARFIPVMFVECATDLVHFCRKTCPGYSVLIEIRPEIPLFFMTHFRSDIIHHQPTREYILMTVGGLVDMHEAHRRQVGSISKANPRVTTRFFAHVLYQFSDTMAWTLVVGMLFRFNSGNAFCMTEVDESIRWTTVFQDPDPIPTEAYTAYIEMNQLVLEYCLNTRAWADGVPESSPLSFFKSAVTHANWCVAELSAVLAATDPCEALTQEVRMRRQRAVSIFDYAVKTLHILGHMTGLLFDFFFNTDNACAGTVPQHNVPPISPSSKALMVIEVVVQCLGRFVASDSSLSQVVAARLSGFEGWLPEKIIAPVVGTLMAMMGAVPPAVVAETAHLSAAEGAAMWRARRSEVPAATASFVEGLVANNVFFRQMAQPRVDWDHSRVLYALTEVDWAAVCRRAHSNSNLLKPLAVTAMAYEALHEARSCRIEGELSLAALRQHNHNHDDGARSDTSKDDGLCAICCVSPLEVVFEPCGHSSCQACIERHQMSDRRCFYCKADVERTREYTKDT